MTTTRHGEEIPADMVRYEIRCFAASDADLPDEGPGWYYRFPDHAVYSYWLRADSQQQAQFFAERAFT